MIGTVYANAYDDLSIQWLASHSDATQTGKSRSVSTAHLTSEGTRLFHCPTVLVNAGEHMTRLDNAK